MKKVLLTVSIAIVIVIAALMIFKHHFLYQCADLSGLEPIKNPAYISNSPVILLDEGHGNFHTIEGRYKPFAQLLTADGYRLRPSTGKLSAENLAAADVLVIANAVDPLSKAEINAVVAWVKEGKSLLLVADHPPFSSPLQELCLCFGVDLGGMWTFDPAQKEPDAPHASWIRYRRAKGALGEHPIFEGRYPRERINVITLFTGQSMDSKTGTPLLKLSDSAQDYETREQAKKGIEGKSAAGRAQAVAVEFEKGRIVVLGEAGMLTAQAVRFLFFTIKKFGFNLPGNDNRQFVLNIMHWLTHLI